MTQFLLLAISIVTLISDVTLSFQALIAVLPQARMKYFDFQSKTWKPLLPTVPSFQAAHCNAAVSVGCNLFVAGIAPVGGFYLYRYDTESNAWEMKQLPSTLRINNLCILGDYIYAISSNLGKVPQRYNIAKRQWQSISKLSSNGIYQACNIGAIVHSKVSIFVLCSNINQKEGKYQPAVLHCFDLAKNEWKEKARTCQPHFGSSLFEVNGKLFVAGGKCSLDQRYNYPAPVEVYSEETNTWSVVKQEHIPANNLGAVEIEGRVYFIINQFPIDSGIRISPEERYPVPLDEWKNLGKIEQCAVLCYLPLKREYMKTE